MLSKKIEAICNRQVEREGFSSNLYLAMASWAENQGLAGIAGWFYAQSEEERVHMLKFIKYINERGGQAIVPLFEKPPVDYKNVEEAFNEVLKHERFITSSINEIVSLTLEEKDYNTNHFLQWFVMEQSEEEASAQAIIDKLNLGGKNHLYVFDKDIMRFRGTASKEQPAT